MKNQFKKTDSKGNKLNENIGGGLNYAHLKKVKEARLKTEEIRFRATKENKDFLREVSEVSGLSQSEILTNLLERFLKGEIEIK